MRKNRIIILCAVLSMTAAFHAFARDVLDDEIYVPSARSYAIGGKHAAVTTDLSTLFNNPAGFQKAGPEMSLAEVTFRIGGPIFDIAGVVASGIGGGTGDLLTSPDVQDLLQGLYASIDILGPVAFGYIGGGLGFGFFNNSEIELVNSSPLTIGSTVSEELILCGGYSFRIPLSAAGRSTLDLGLLMKGSLKGKVTLEKSFLEFPTLISNLGTDTLLVEPFQFISAIGIDLGALYSFNDRLSVGLVGRDVFTPALISTYSTVNAFLENTETPSKSNAVLPLDLSLGVLYSPRIGKLERIFTNLNFMLDYSDIFDFLIQPENATNPLLHIGFGSELTLLEILSVRVGLNEGLFSAGLGLDLTFFTLNAAMFGSENTSEPGLKPVYNVILGLEFRI